MSLRVIEHVQQGGGGSPCTDTYEMSVATCSLFLLNSKAVNSHGSASDPLPLNVFMRN